MTDTLKKKVEEFQNSDLWKSSESRAAIFVTGTLVVIAAFLVYNYYEKTEDLSLENNGSSIEELAEGIDSSEEGRILANNVENPNAYIVNEGDTLWSIAEDKLGDPYRWAEIKDVNQLETSEVESGDVLTLPAIEKAEVSNTEENTENNETIQPTETEEKKLEETENEVLVEEEKQEETEPEVLAAEEEKEDETEISETETLAETAIGTPETYTVERGDTLWNIAEKTYGDAYQYTKILNANPNLGRLPNGNVLIHSGNVLAIPAI